MVGHVSAKRRTGAALLLVFAGLYAVPLARAFQPGKTSTKSCCRTKGDCCCKTERGKSQPGWRAVSECLRQCQGALGLALKLYALTDLTVTKSARPMLVEEIGVVESTSGQGSAYPAFLYQRPPPRA
jgi:hypothetical protein